MVFPAHESARHEITDFCVGTRDERETRCRGTDERIEPLGAYLVRRFFLMLLTLFGISVIIFVLLRVMPGNIVDILYDAAGYVNPREKAKIEAELGLDKPIVIQYVTWISGLAQADLGYSYVSERPALEEIAPRIPITEHPWTDGADGVAARVPWLSDLHGFFSGACANWLWPAPRLAPPVQCLRCPAAQGH
jgi:hypothetical protein